MDYPDKPFQRFRFLGIPFKRMAQQAALGQLDELAFRTYLKRAVAFADLHAFQRECLQYPLLQAHCQVVMADTTTWLRSFRSLALRLLEQGAEVKSLKQLNKHYQVLDEIVPILVVAAERAMGPTPDGDINVLLRLAAQRNFSRLKFACKSNRDALASWPLEPWRKEQIAALHQLLEELKLRERGDRADRPPDWRGALAELKRVGMLLPVPEGPQPCDLLEKREPVSAIWRKDVCNFIISRAFPDWPWWWIWPMREPFLTVNEMLERGTIARHPVRLPESEKAKLRLERTRA